MASGTVKKVDEKGFGFISQEDKRDIFFHASGMVDRAAFDQVQPGDRVEFDVDTSGERPRAVNVNVITN